MRNPIIRSTALLPKRDQSIQRFPTYHFCSTSFYTGCSEFSGPSPLSRALVPRQFQPSGVHQCLPICGCGCVRPGQTHGDNLVTAVDRFADSI
jgi:hypothetical protein